MMITDVIQFLLFRSTNDFTALTCNDDKGNFNYNFNLRKIWADITMFRIGSIFLPAAFPIWRLGISLLVLNFLNIFLFRKQAREPSYKSCTTRLYLEIKTKYKNYSEKELVSVNRLIHHA